MLITPIRIFRIPEPQATRLRHIELELDSLDFAVDLLAWINGEEMASITPVREERLTQFSVLGLLPPNARTRMIRVVTDDEEGLPPLMVPVIYLRRRFHLVDDYLEAFPNADSIELSLTRDEVAAIIEPKHAWRVPVDQWLAALEYLNPKDPTHYFFRSTVGMPRHLIERYASLVPEEVRWNIVKTRHYRYLGSVPLPEQGRGLTFLGHVFSGYSDIDNLRLFFREYPSYLTLEAVNIYINARSPATKKRANDLFEELITTTNYGEYEEITILDDEVHAALIRQLLSTLSKTDDWKVAKRILTMMSIKRSLFGNLNDYVPAPYLRTNLGDYREEPTVESPFVINLHRLLEVPLETVLEAVKLTR